MVSHPLMQIQTIGKILSASTNRNKTKSSSPSTATIDSLTLLVSRREDLCQRQKKPLARSSRLMTPTNLSARVVEEVEVVSPGKPQLAVTLRIGSQSRSKLPFLTITEVTETLTKISWSSRNSQSLFSLTIHQQRGLLTKHLRHYERRKRELTEDRPTSDRAPSQHHIPPQWLIITSRKQRILSG